MLAPYTPVGARPLSRPVPCLRLRMQRVQTPKAHPTPLIFAAAKGVVSRSPVPRVPEAVIGVNNKLSAGEDTDDQVTPAVAVTSPTRTSSSAAQPTSSSSYDEKWHARYKELAAYHKKHGHCLVPARFAPHPGLGRWVRYQRALHSEGRLSEERVTRLDALGFSWDAQQAQRRSKGGDWDRRYEELAAFHARHAHCAVPRSMLPLAEWCNAQRKARREGSLPSMRVSQLDELSFNWDTPLFFVSREERWMENYRRLCVFRETHGHCAVPQRHVDDPPLGVWCHTQRRAAGEGRLSAERRALLGEVGFLDGGRQLDTTAKAKAAENAAWEHNCQQLQAIASGCEESGGEGDAVATEGCTFSDPGLEEWLARQAAARRAGRLSAKRDARLRAAGVAWREVEVAGSPAKAWSVRLEQLQRFKRMHGHVDVPQRYARIPGLGRWVGEQRASYWAGRLTDDRVAALAELGFQFSGDASSDPQWRRRLDQLSEWMANNSSRETLGTRTATVGAGLQLQLLMAEQPRLGAWLLRQRRLAGAQLLPPTREAALASLGALHDSGGSSAKSAISELWERRFVQLAAHLEAHEGFEEVALPAPLAAWLAAQRKFRQLGSLDPARAARLAALPHFSWAEAPDGGWEGRYSQLDAFWRRHGHCRVPLDGPTARLGRWVKAQRRAHRTGRLSADQARALDALGFHWGNRPQEDAAAWDAHLEALKALKSKRRRVDLKTLDPTSLDSRQKRALRWAGAQAHEHRTGRLDSDRAKALEEVVPGLLRDEGPCLFQGRWSVGLHSLVRFKEATGHAAVPKDHGPLGRWAEEQRAARASGRLDHARRAALDAVGFEWNSESAATAVVAPAPADPSEASSLSPPNCTLGGTRGTSTPRFTSNSSDAVWGTRFQELVAFRAQFGHCCVPRGGDSLLGHWVSLQRALASTGALPAERVARLEEVGFVWDAKDAESVVRGRPSATASEWADRLSQLSELRRREDGDAALLAAEDPSFASWASSVREARAEGRLPAASEQALVGLGFAWEVSEERAAATWLSRYNALRAHKSTAGHFHDLQWSSADVSGPLPVWVAVQRYKYATGKLSRAVARRLVELGLDLGGSWDERVAQLRAYLRSHGDCCVPVDSSAPELRALAIWAQEQRELKATRRLHPSRVAQLDGLGFQWQS